MKNDKNDGDAEFRRKVRQVKTGYATATLLFVIALVCFIGGIMSGVGAVAGVGGIFTLGAAVALVVTVAYHNLSGLLDAQERRQRDRRF